jgi:hypothetical protein
MKADATEREGREVIFKAENVLTDGMFVCQTEF